MKQMMAQISDAGGRYFDALVIGADRGARAPGVVLGQEIFGINSFMRARAELLAAQGFIVAVPDLFWRRERGVQLDPGVESDRERAMNLFKSMKESEAIADCVAATSWLRGHPACNGSVGFLGFCWGGTLAYLMAARGATDAAVAYYGVGIHNALNEVDGLTRPLLVHIAEQDHLCPPEAQKAIKEALAGRSDVYVHGYAGTGHGFARSGGPTYDAGAAALADSRSYDFLKRHLRWSQADASP